MKKILFVFSFIITLVGYNFVYAENPCNPSDVKPPYEGTGIGKMSISPDIVTVGGLMTIMVQTARVVSDLNIDIPANSELQDYFPKDAINNATQSTTDKSVNWHGEVPAGDYSITVKVNHWTADKWAKTGYSAVVPAGFGPGTSYYFAYYNTIPLEISLDDRNQASQSTKDVVRKVIVKGVRDLRITLETNSGEVGTSISEKTGNSATIKANPDGVSTFFLFTQEGAKVKLTASSPDTCIPSTKETTFTIKRSDVARTYVDYSWLWWLGGTLILVAIIIIIFIKRKKKISNQTISSQANMPTIPVSGYEKPTLPTQSVSADQTTQNLSQNNDNINKENL